MRRIGVLALQGAFAEHIAVLEQLGVEAVAVRLPQQLDNLDGLVIPGGESTTISKLMAYYNIEEVVRRLGKDGLPIMGTCAGMVLMAKKVVGLNQPPLGLMDIEIKRNAFGRQVDSFETDLQISVLGESPFRAVFIRAPLIERAGPGVEILARLPDGIAVAARQKKLVAVAFHPELTPDRRLHDYFLRLTAAP